MLDNSLNLYGTVYLPVKWEWWLSHSVVRTALEEIIYAEHAVYSRHIIATSLVVKWKLLSRVQLYATPWTVVHGILQARILVWVAVPFSRGSSQTQGPNPGLLHCSHQGSPTSLVQSVSSVAQSCPTLSAPRWLQHTRLLCPPPTPGAYSNSCPLGQWCHPTISSSVVFFSSHLQSFPASGSFPMNQFSASGGQSIGVSASASVLPMNIQDWFPLGLTRLISLQYKRLSRVFSSTIIQT